MTILSLSKNILHKSSALLNNKRIQILFFLNQIKKNTAADIHQDRL